MIAPTSGLPPVGAPVHTYFQPQTQAAASKPGAAAESALPNRDSTAFPPAPAGESAFQKELVSRLSKEVRTATTTGDIRALRQAVSAGTYVPDPMAIAGRILSLAGGRG